jgi:hypothetical protein
VGGNLTAEVIFGGSVVKAVTLSPPVPFADNAALPIRRYADTPICRYADTFPSLPAVDMSGSFVISQVHDVSSVRFSPAGSGALFLLVHHQG